ncbi:MAG: hypothetical protein PHN18_12945 [Sulfurospirillaceae bacterium]|nr:hypothetical protein [Sulfurospirillaceae bacterium]MDD2827769.1 hypothetical protein [Sulfurospirillaceae bacterium]
MKNIFYPIIIVLIFLPLGLISENPAWAEWENEYYQEMLGFIPKGIENAFHMKALIPDYTIAGINEVVAYYLSGIVGITLIFGFFYFLGKKIAR